MRKPIIHSTVAALPRRGTKNKGATMAHHKDDHAVPVPTTQAIKNDFEQLKKKLADIGLALEYQLGYVVNRFWST
jgi:hypothetical protein